MSPPDFDADTLASLDRLAERGYTLQHYIETAAAQMTGSAQQAADLVRELRADKGLFATLVITQAVLDSADACNARLERIADTLDDLVEAIERSTEGDEVPAC